MVFIHGCYVFVLRVSPAQRRVIRKNRPEIENPILVLYSTYFHPRPSPPLLRTTFPPFPRPLWGAPAHAERTRATLDSSKANVARGTISAARLRGPSGETTAPWFIARIAGQNQVVYCTESDLTRTLEK